jgi:late competence protein required for DNA uptake (superfamily II DNA/RNA helicase)
VSIHGSKSQEERNEAMELFRAGKKDVLVATDIAAKGAFTHLRVASLPLLVFSNAIVQVLISLRSSM